MLQSTLGNLPELFVVIFALKAGEVVVAQTSILGSLFANALLVLGLVIIAGARASEGSVMRFHPRLPNDTATLLLLASFLIVLLGLSVSSGDKAAEHQVEISAVGAVVLLVVYAIWLCSYLRADIQRPEAAEEEGHAPPLSLRGDARPARHRRRRGGVRVRLVRRLAQPGDRRSCTSRRRSRAS